MKRLTSQIVLLLCGYFFATGPAAGESNPQDDNAKAVPAEAETDKWQFLSPRFIFGRRVFPAPVASAL